MSGPTNEDLEDRIREVQRRTEHDPTLSGLSATEQAAYYAGQADRAWLRVGLFLIGAAVGLCTVAIAGGLL